MTYSTEMKLLKGLCLVSYAVFAGVVLLAALGIVSYFMAG